MKYSWLFSVLVFLLLSCNSAKTPVVGEWELIEFGIYAEAREPVVSNEETLRDVEAIWDFTFNNDGSFSQDFNMQSENKEIVTQKGTYELKEDTIFVHFDINKNVPMKYVYLVDEDVLTLTANNEIIKTKIISKFRKK